MKVFIDLWTKAVLQICGLVSSGVFSQLGLFPANAEAAASRADLACLQEPRYTLLVLWELPHFISEIFFSLNFVSNKTQKVWWCSCVGLFWFCCCFVGRFSFVSKKWIVVNQSSIYRLKLELYKSGGPLDRRKAQLLLMGAAVNWSLIPYPDMGAEAGDSSVQLLLLLICRVWEWKL